MPIKLNQSVLETLKENLRLKKQSLNQPQTSSVVFTKNLPEKQRIKLGKEHEKYILEKLAKFGTIVVSTAQEDMRFKLDGFITFTDPLFSEFKEKTSLQIKKRVQSGNDILFEVERDFNNNIIGRDQKGNSTLYIVSDMNGRIGVFRTQLLKEIVKSLLDKDPTNFKFFKDSQQKTGVVSCENGAELRVIKGNPEFTEGSRKLLAFIPFQLASPIVVL